MATERPRRSPSIRLMDADEKTDLSTLAIYALDAKGNIINSAAVDNSGAFELPEKVLASAQRVAVAPAASGKEPPDLRNAVELNPRELTQSVKDLGVIDIARTRWTKLFPIARCVDGSVRACTPYPWLLRELEVQAFGTFDRIATPSIIFPRRCRPVCNALVEVYRRVCCCRPYYYLDPRIRELIEILREKVRVIKPPIPRPDPPPFAFTRVGVIGKSPLIHENGTLDELALNAATDLEALETLDPNAQLQYLEARPYLRCYNRCQPPVKVAEGFVQPDGTFHICWRSGIYLGPFCHEEYAYKVRQNVNGTTYTIYDGVAANAWSSDRSDVELTSYSRHARTCPHPEDDEDTGDAAVWLEHIGDTDSYALKEPLQNAPLSVAGPFEFNDGLLNPGPEADRSRNLNLGGALDLRFYFTRALAPIARYYRVSVSRADANGNPTGSREYFMAPLSWTYSFSAGGGIIDESAELLGPQTVGGNANLYRIPYPDDRDWEQAQYHATVFSNQFADGRHLVTLEVFDATGRRIHPNGTPAIDAGDAAAAFAFQRREADGPHSNVPFGALTHLMWWDNRLPHAEIVNLRKNGSSSAEECQFIDGAEDDQFSVGYRAYHDNPIVLAGYSMTWKRGLNGASNLLDSGTMNAGVPPAMEAITPAVSFASLLGDHERCAFALTLSVATKTTNGKGRVYADAVTTAAFALSID